MTNDLLKLLRGQRVDGRTVDEVMALAADEIQALRVERHQLQNDLTAAGLENERLTRERDQLSAGVDGLRDLKARLQEENEHLREVIARCYMRMQCADVPRDPWHWEVCTTLDNTGIPSSHEPNPQASVSRLPTPGTQLTRLSDIADELIRQLRKQGMEKMQAVFDGMRLRIDPWPEPVDAHKVQCKCGWVGMTTELVRLDDKHECPACSTEFKALSAWPALKSNSSRLLHADEDVYTTCNLCERRFNVRHTHVCDGKPQA